MATTRKANGISLAKGPVGIVGLALLAYGITALIFGGHGFAQHAPNGAVYGKTWLGLQVNGWSGLLFIAAGLLLLLGAPLHWGAKSMSLIVGVALGVAALIALANGHGALGIFAANHLTELVWGAAAVLLVLLALLPRVGGKTKQRNDRGERRHAEPNSQTVEPEPVPKRTDRAERQGLPANGSRTDTRHTRAASDTTTGSRDPTAESG